MEAALIPDELKNICYVSAGTINEFEKIICKTDPDNTLIVYATHVLYQFPSETLNKFYDMLDHVALQRDLYFLSVEGYQIVKRKIQYFGNSRGIDTL